MKGGTLSTSGHLALLPILVKLDVEVDVSANRREVCNMNSISMVEFRNRADAILQKVRQGQSFTLTYRGEAVARLEPVSTAAVTSEDPFYGIAELASAEGDSLTNDEIDRIVYGA